MADQNNNVLTLKGVKVKHKVVEVGQKINDAEKGELFLSAVATDVDASGNPIGTIDPHTGKVIPPVYVMRVGTGANDGGTGWLHAPASDVHPWAKMETFDAAFAGTGTDTRLTTIENLVDGSGGADGNLVDQINGVLTALTTFKEQFNQVPADQLVTGFEYKNENNTESFTINTVDQSTFATSNDLDELINGPTDDRVTSLAPGNIYTSFNKLSNAFNTFMTAEDSATEALNTLIELQKWIDTHDEVASGLITDVEAHEEAIGDLKTAIGSNESESGLVYDLTTLTGRVTELDKVDGRVAAVEAAASSNANDIGTIQSTGIFFTAVQTVDNNKVTKVAKMANISPATGTDSITLILDCN